MQRRSFLVSASTALAMQTGPRGGIIGSGGRGTFLTGEFKEVGAQMAAVCDVYEANLARGLKAASTGATAYSDYRRLLEDKTLDFVVVATPDHWHARMVIDACQAGKDAYVEKPMAHTIEEGARMIPVVRRTKRVVQVGTQRRSSELFIEGKKLMEQAGNVRLVQGWWINHQAGAPDKPLQGKLDWQQWLGNSPQRELDTHRFFNWYYYYDYSGGLMIGQAAHIIDMMLWFMNADAPAVVTAIGTKPNLERVEISETTSIAMEFPQENFIATFTVGYKGMRYSGFLDQLSQFHGHKARLDMGREHYALYPEDPKAIELKAAAEKRLPGSFNSATRAHIRNFLECIRDRRDPNAPVEAGQRTNIALCLAMDSLRLGKKMPRPA